MTVPRKKKPKTTKKVDYAKKFLKDFEAKHHINRDDVTVEQQAAIKKEMFNVQEQAYVPVADEESVILHELENVKLYLFDIVKRLDKLETHFTPMVGSILAPIPEFDRNALYKGPNAGKGQDFVRKNVAKILANMLPKATLDLMPREVRDAYHNILSVMGAPNDPVWEKEIPRDPREPVPPPSPAETFQNVTDLWNNVANNMKKLDGVNLSDEIARAAAEVESAEVEENKDESNKHESDQ